MTFPSEAEALNLTSAGHEAALKRAHAAGYAEGLERAAAECERLDREMSEHPEWARTCAEAIRQLKEKP